MKLINLFCMSVMLSVQTPDVLKVKEFVLENGLTVWINEDHTEPMVYGAVVVKAGAKDSPNTGIAHYFEHIMFKGTGKIGSTDYDSEKVWLDSIAVKYDELAATKDIDERREIQKEINSLSIKAAEYAIPNEFSRLISQFGGSKLNAFTSFDITAYHNEFSPQYFRQWAELNSERLMDPVFRLFQSELETVYEEKNMYDDTMGMLAMNKLLERVAAPHPYMYPILGSTESLKNPSLSDMNRFFEQYYVANNMGLILAGDIVAEEVLPILEETFGRIRRGDLPEREYQMPRPLEGVEKFEVKFPIPMVKAAAFVWHGVPANHPDQMALNIAAALLNNENGTGLLDELMVSKKVMAAAVMNMSMNDAGALGMIVVPKLVFQSLSSAKSLVMEQMNRIKRGDFDENVMRSIVLELKRSNLQQLENINTRSSLMINLLAQGKSWDEYIAQISSIDNYTKEDIVKIANKYFTGDYLDVKKKSGNYPKEHLQKPPFAPIIPKNRDAKSQYALALEEVEVSDIPPKFIDFDRDVVTYDLSPLTRLYLTDNKINDIFTLSIVYGKGAKESKLLSPLSSYLTYLGTEEKSFEIFRSSLQQIGATLTFETTGDYFVANISGFDDKFEETLALAAEFLVKAKGDKKQLSQLADAKKVELKGMKESPDMLADALFQWVVYGDNSSYLNRLSYSELKDLTVDRLMSEFRAIQQVECDIHYCGKLIPEKVVSAVRKYVDIEGVDVKSNSPTYKEKKVYNESVVYFVNTPKSQQSIINIYALGGENDDLREKHIANLLTFYMSGGMSSIVFQEIREFRSLAYRTSLSYTLSPYKYLNKPATIKGLLSTQNDKAIEAIEVMNSIIRDMPQKPERLEAAKQEIVNNIYASYPAFRSISREIARYKKSGLDQDPNIALIAALEDITMDDLMAFYRENMQSNTLVYLVVGNEKNLDMEGLSKFGKVIKIKAEEVYR